MAARAQSSVIKPVLVVAGIGILVVILGSALGWDLFGRKKGAVRGTTTASKDTDRDGWVDPDDPLPNSPNDPDNDGITNAEDIDDDGDGVADTRDYIVNSETGLRIDLSFDQNNNQKIDPEEIHMNPDIFDGDRDGRPTKREWLRAARAGAQADGRTLRREPKSLAGYTAEDYAKMRDGWWKIAYDHDDDGSPDGVDKKPGKPDFGGRTGPEAYFVGGAWERAYAQYAARTDALGSIIRCLACEGTERGGGITPESTGGVVTAGGGGSLGLYSGHHGSGWPSAASGGIIGRILGAGSPYREFHKYYGQHSEHYASKPQFQGGQYVRVEEDGGAGGDGGGAGSGRGHFQSGGYWRFVGAYAGGGAEGGGAAGGGGDAGGGAGGGGEAGGGGYQGGGGFGGHCSKC